MVGGHPRSLEYLDALLANGEGRYPDITTRLTKSLVDKLGAEKASTFLASQRTLDAALAETAVLAADDVLLDDLLATLGPGAERVLLGCSVFREPVDTNGLVFQVGEVDEDAAVVPDRKAANEAIGAMGSPSVEPFLEFDGAHRGASTATTRLHGRCVEGQFGSMRYPIPVGHMWGTALVRGLGDGTFPQVRGVSAGACAA